MFCSTKHCYVMMNLSLVLPCKQNGGDSGEIGMYTGKFECAPYWLPIQYKYCHKMGSEIDEKRRLSEERLVILWSIKALYKHTLIITKWFKIWAKIQNPRPF